MADSNAGIMIDPQIFQYLQAHAEEQTEVNDKLNQITTVLNRHISAAQGHLSRIHATPAAKRELPMLRQRAGANKRTTVGPLLEQVEKEGIKPAIETIAELSQFASKYPYYK